MADTVSKEIRRKTMQAIKARDTQLENKIITGLWRKGLRFRRNVNHLKGKPDIAIKKYRVVVFLDSCFWHGCTQHCRMPKTNKEYWEKKINRNKERDQEVAKYYKERNWHILRIWEHQIKEDPENVTEKIFNQIQGIKNKTLKDQQKRNSK